MEHYLTLRIVHGATAVLLLLGVIVHLLMLWKAARGGKVRAAAQVATHPPAVSAAVGGDRTVVAADRMVDDTSGRMAAGAAMAAGQLRAVRRAGSAGAAAGRPPRHWQAPGNATAARNAGIYGVLVLLVLIAITALMGAKPV